MTNLVVAGTAIIYKSKFNISIATGQPYKTMESTCFCVNTGNRMVNLIAIYRPPDSNVLEFCKEFTNLLEYSINSSGELLLLGVFNITINKPFDAEPATFLDILGRFNLVSKVGKPTHRLSNTLDLIHDADSNIIPKIRWADSSLTTVLYSLTLPHSALLPPQKCRHTESAKTSTPMPL